MDNGNINRIFTYLNNVLNKKMNLLSENFLKKIGSLNF
jgi:hypothetical protein